MADWLAAHLLFLPAACLAELPACLAAAAACSQVSLMCPRYSRCHHRRGLHVVGEAAVAMTIFTLLPFAALCLLGEQSRRTCPAAAAAVRQAYHSVDDGVRTALA
jgi:hypothetical protein